MKPPAASCERRLQDNLDWGYFMNGWGITDRGTVRSQNQDFYGLDFVAGRDVALCVVCDGMGGANAGNVASSIAVEAFMDYMKQGLKTANGMAELSGLVRRSASYANSMVYEVARSEPECFGMGTTLVGALVMGEYASIINIGDSRAYHITPDGISRVTKDHSLVEDMIDRGDLTREEAESHPDKNLITRALGVEPGVPCDLFEIRIRKGECLLLCTDGLTNCIDEKVIWETVALSEDRAKSCQKLIDIAIEDGATDNVTAVLLEK